MFCICLLFFQKLSLCLIPSKSLSSPIETPVAGDELLEKEFLSKRRSLWFHLKEEGYIFDLEYYLNPDYDRSFDNFLYQEVGYPMLAVLTSNLFYSPYGATSLREYFANGFEAIFYHRDPERLKKISPILLDKITKLMYNEDYEVPNT